MENSQKPHLRIETALLLFQPTKKQRKIQNENSNVHRTGLKAPRPEREI